MKKAAFALLLVLSQCLHAQVDTIYENGVLKIRRLVPYEEPDPSPLRKDDYLLELSYGVPYTPWREANVFGTNLYSNINTIKIVSNTQHLCADIDYQLNRQYSVGLELTYAAIDYQYRRRFTVPNGSSYLQRDSTYKMHTSQLRFLAKIAFHFNISERFDAYGTAGFGYKDQRYTSNDSYINSNNSLNNVVPVAIRLSAGGRFFFSKNLALRVEGGLGGPVMQIGLSYKINGPESAAELLKRSK